MERITELFGILWYNMSNDFIQGSFSTTLDGLYFVSSVVKLIFLDIRSIQLSGTILTFPYPSYSWFTSQDETLKQIFLIIDIKLFSQCGSITFQMEFVFIHFSHSCLHYIEFGEVICTRGGGYQSRKSSGIHFSNFQENKEDILFPMKRIDSTQD